MPQSPLVITRASVTDDAAPSGVTTNEFVIPAWVDINATDATGYVRLSLNVLNATVAVSGTYTVQLWVFISGAWTAIGAARTLVTTPAGQPQVFSIPTSEVAQRGFFQITSITGTGAASVRLEVSFFPSENLGLKTSSTGSGGILTEETRIPTAENNTLGVFFGHQRAVNSALPAFTLDAAPAAVTGKAVKATPGMLYGFNGENNNASKRWIMFFNATAVPSNGTAAAYQIPVAGSAEFRSPDWLATCGVYFSTGISVALSTTQGTLTLGAAEMVIFTAVK